MPPKEINKDDPFICKLCKREFIAAWSDEDAAKQAKKDFNLNKDEDEYGIVCGDCFSKLFN